MPEGMTAAGAHTRAEAEAAFTELMEHIKEIETAAREWGIRPDHLEGRFVSAMAAAQAGLGRIAVAASKDALAVAGLVRAAADSEAERMRSSVAMVDTQLRRIDAEVRRAEIHRKDLETKTVASLTKAVAEKLKDVLVIRERRWNRRDRHISGAQRQPRRARDPAGWVHVARGAGSLHLRRRRRGVGTLPGYGVYGRGKRAAVLPDRIDEPAAAVQRLLSQ